MLPLVSIHFPTFNHERFVAQAIDSALNQSYENIEICISDDYSTDGTREILRSYAKSHQDVIRVNFQAANVGMVKNLNAALEMCAGKYVCFLTGDDYFYPDKVRRQVQLFERDRTLALVGHLIRTIDSEGTELKSALDLNLAGRGPRKWIENGPLYSALSIMVLRESIPDIGFDERVPVLNDIKFWVDCLANGGGYKLIRERLGVYRKTPKGVTADVMRCINEYPNLYEVLQASYPQWSSSCRKGLINGATYGRGVYYANAGDFARSNEYFLKALKENPGNVKPIIRLMLNVVGLVRSKI